MPQCKTCGRSTGFNHFMEISRATGKVFRQYEWTMWGADRYISLEDQEKKLEELNGFPYSSYRFEQVTTSGYR